MRMELINCLPPPLQNFWIHHSSPQARKRLPPRIHHKTWITISVGYSLSQLRRFRSTSHHTSQSSSSAPLVSIALIFRTCSMKWISFVDFYSSRYWVDRLPPTLRIWQKYCYRLLEKASTGTYALIYWLILCHQDDWLFKRRSVCVKLITIINWLFLHAGNIIAKGRHCKKGQHWEIKIMMSYSVKMSLLPPSALQEHCHLRPGNVSSGTLNLYSITSVCLFLRSALAARH